MPRVRVARPHEPRCQATTGEGGPIQCQLRLDHAEHMHYAKHGTFAYSWRDSEE